MAEGQPRILKWLTAATAVISLILGGRQLINMASDRAERARQAEAKQRDAAESIAVARQQAAHGEYAEAWRSLDRADERTRTDDGAAARLEVAFRWLEEARKPADQKFSSITDVVVPALDRASLDEHHPRRADVLAHLGWATFLRYRDTQTGDPEPAYRQALQVDSKNPYANAMLAHWLLLNRRSIDSTRQYLDAAVESGKDRAFVRGFQIAALRNRNDAEADTELIRVADAMRQQHDTPDAASARVLYQAFRLRYTRTAVDVDPRTIGVSVADQLATFKWLMTLTDGSDSGDANARVIAALERSR